MMATLTGTTMTGSIFKRGIWEIRSIRRQSASLVFAGTAQAAEGL